MVDLKRISIAGHKKGEAEAYWYYKTQERITLHKELKCESFSCSCSSFEREWQQVGEFTWVARH